MERRGRSLRSIGFAATAAAVTLLIPSPALAGTLDQQQPIVGGTTVNAHSQQSVAQTFTAGLTGRLDQVDLNLNKIGTPPVPLTIELRDVSAGLPGSTVLASQSVLSPSVVASPSSSWISFAFPTPVPVTAGTQYSIVAHSAAVDPPDTYAWKVGTGTDPYPAGAAYTASPPTAPWMIFMFGPPDFAFKTYVIPAPPQAPAAATPPTGRRAAALAKCKRTHSAKQRRKCRKRARLLPV